MADETTAALRAMATHQGFKLKTSRRRKPGGDYGKFGLEDASGKPALGIGKGGLEASAAEIEAFLRARSRASWASSTKGLKRSKAPPPPKPRGKSKPKPKFKPDVANLFAKLPAARRAEAASDIFEHARTRVERIVSAGQVTPDDAPLKRDHDTWVIVLAGEADLRIEDSDAVTLKPGDHVTVAARQRHWVTRASVEPPAVWLTVHAG